MMARHEPMIRTQLLLTPALRERLQALAQREGRSPSDVVRRALDAGLDTLEGTEEGRVVVLAREIERLRGEADLSTEELMAGLGEQRERCRLERRPHDPSSG
jgi:predicted DNA-binding protein